MVNALEFGLLVLQAGDPDLFYGFMAMIFIGTAVSFLQGVKFGLATTAIVALLFYYSEFFYPYTIIIAIVTTALLIIDIITISKIEREIDNFISGIYLYYRIIKDKRKHR